MEPNLNASIVKMPSRAKWFWQRIGTVSPRQMSGVQMPREKWNSALAPEGMFVWKNLLLDAIGC